ncbi:MAG TPA: 30S ribosomal protein S16 [Polyangiales bacterium]|jgi:small subunit ribosomal protein S16|nr:30S ribosomal protein S16 [Polyangiales bacterium]
MVKIRFARFGAKKRPFYHIVVTDSENPRDGRFLEQIGTYDPSKPMTLAKLERDRLDHWLGRGAQLSTSLAKVVREQAKAPVAAG